MFCIKCGKQTGDESRVCPECAVKFGYSESSAAPAPAPIQPPPPPTPNAGFNPPPPPTGFNPPPVAPPPGMYGGGYRLVSDRALWKMILLGIVTLGIYPAIVQAKMVHELNIAAFKHDGNITLSQAVLSPLFVLTIFIYFFVYQHQYAARLRNELNYRGIRYSIAPVHFWILNVLLGVTIVCPLIYAHKVIKAHNLINNDYNMRGE